MIRKTGITLCLELLFVYFGVLSAESITLSNIEVSAIRNNSAVISWDSETAATGQVEYGSWKCYGSITDQEGLSYWHSIEVTGLTEGTDYHFRIKAADCEGNETVSGESFFTTRTQMELHSIVRAARKNGDDPIVYYMSPDGNDSWSGLSLDSAWASLSHAQNQLQPGDTLFIADGTYINDMFVAQTCGTPEAPITINGRSIGKQYSVRYIYS